MLDSFGLIDEKIMPIDKLDPFLISITNQYLTSTLYHNSMHGADITQTICFFFNNSNAEEVSHLSEQVKLKEKGGNKTVLGGIPDSLTSLVKAYRIQDKVANVGFDWEHREDVWEKVKEEIAEFEDELKAQSDKGPCTKEAEGEFGDLLFALINAARLYKIRPDDALEQTNLKFIRRFNYLEARAKEQGRELKDMSLDEMEALWQEAKALETND